MLRITIHDDSEPLTFQIEGKLAGPWVQEAQACWKQALASRGHPVIQLDLTGVTLIDAAGKSFLAAAQAQGARLFASGCLMRAIVAELTAATALSGS
jgi:anti-anti-sigma regulatory factor